MNNSGECVVRTWRSVRFNGQLRRPSWFAGLSMHALILCLQSDVQIVNCFYTKLVNFLHSIIVPWFRYVERVSSEKRTIE